MVREARIDVSGLKRCLAVLYVAAAAQALLPFVALAAHRHYSHLSAARPARSVPYPRLELPLQINGSQYIPLSWSDIPGWYEDDQLAAYRTFRAS